MISDTIAPMPDSPPAGPPPWPPMAPARGPRWPVLAMLALTVVAVVAAVAAWLRPMPEAGSGSGGPVASFSDQQVADAKARVCAAWEKIDRALRVNSTSVDGDDPTTQLAVAVKVRQIYVAGSAYLLSTLEDNPATPSNVAVPAKRLAALFQVITLDILASEPSDTEHNEADETLGAIAKQCR